LADGEPKTAPWDLTSKPGETLGVVAIGNVWFSHAFSAVELL